MDEDLKYVGKSIPIHDALEKAAGKIKYVGDMKLHGMLYAKLLLSTVAHGIIKNIDTSEAEKLPGVVKIFTHKNTPNTLYNSHKWIEGIDVIKDERLFTDKSRFVGDRIAAVVAKDKETAERAVKLINVEYENLPVIVNPEEALKNEDIKIHQSGNFIDKKVIQCGNAEDVINSSKLVFCDRVETPKVHHAAMEPHVCLCDVNPFGEITVWSPCQVVFQVRLIVSEVLGLPLNKIRVIKAPIGGSFGGKGQPILEPVCAFLSYSLKAPVKLQMDRTESIIGTRTRTSTVGYVKTAVDRDGNILARDINIVVDSGAYLTNGTAVAAAMGKKSFRLYKIKNQRYEADIVYTNTPVGGACRGYGSPQIHAITEININNIARSLNMDPVDLRLKNFAEPYDDDPSGGPNLGNVRAEKCVVRGAEAFNWRERRKKKKNHGRFVRGLGMACATHGNGYHGAYPDFITMYLRIDECGHGILKAAIHDLGCGTVTTIRQIAAEVLDMDVENILAGEADTLVSPFDSAGTQASRVTFVCGKCAMITAEKVMEKLKTYSCKILGCSSEDIITERGVIWDKNHCENKLTYGEMVVKIQQRFQIDISETYTYTSSANPACFATNFAEVEVDTLTGLVKVIDVLSVNDVGKAINPGFVEGQIHGAIQMGIGYALSEEISVNKNGSISGDRLSKYHLINAPDMPNIRIILVEDGEDKGPFGAKSIGEIAACAIAPAVVNAINDALNVNITSLPVTPEKIIMAIKKG